MSWRTILRSLRSRGFATAGDRGRSLAVRDLEWERQWSADACRSAGVSCDPLTAFAEDRAGADSVRDLESRDFRQEILEELADARNYLVWAAKQLELRDGSPSSDERMMLFGCLSLVSAAFEMARRFEHA